MTDTHTHTQTDVSDHIICPMLCYSSGTDNYSCTHMATVGVKGLINMPLAYSLNTSNVYRLDET